ncbi:MAG: hypothetical protein J6Z23_03890 [Lachnospiraceae bacterium]|nr:hypothetical protein [Lachnospiraceae bacterium]
MKKGKEIAVDFIFAVVGIAVMTGMVNMVVMPYIERTLGSEVQGNVLFFSALGSLLAGGFGSAANYGRLKIYSEEGKTTNGDFNIFLVSTFVLAALLTLAAIFLKGETAGASYFGILILMCSMVLRFYMDAEYRMNLQYKRVFFAFLTVAVGYVIGILIYPLTHSWVMILLTGEVLGLLFVFIFSSIFRPPFFERSARFKEHLKILYGLAGAYFLSDFVGLSDRLLFPILLSNGDKLNSLYYYASACGKLMSLVSGPLNGVLMGHLSNFEKRPDRRSFLKVVGITLLAFLGCTLISYIASHIFVLWLYPSYYEEVKPLMLLANAGQVLFFICNTLMVVVLRYTASKNQMITSAVYVVTFFAVTIPLVLNFGLYGMAWGILISNTVKFIMFALLGTFGVAKPAEALPPEGEA